MESAGREGGYRPGRRPIGTPPPTHHHPSPATFLPAQTQVHPTNGRWLYDGMELFSNDPTAGTGGYTLLRIPPHWYSVRWPSAVEDMPWDTLMANGILTVSDELGAVEILDQQGVSMRDKAYPNGINPHSLVLPFPGDDSPTGEGRAGNATGGGASASAAGAAAVPGVGEPRAYAMWRYAGQAPQTIHVVGVTSKAYKAGFKTSDGASTAAWRDGWVGGGHQWHCHQQQWAFC